MSGKPFVFVLGSDNRPLMPCTGKRARLLLERGRAQVVRRYPFVIRLIDRTQDNSELQDVQVKIDPGSKHTGMAVVRPNDGIVNVLSLYELEHRGQLIKKKLDARRNFRRRRRSANLRYRKPRFNNRTKPKGWLAPSLMHRVHTTICWVNRFRKWSPVNSLAVERVKFDSQKLQNPEITGIEYQQGTLFNYEVKEYLLEKFNRKCMYCNVSNLPLEIEHIVARANGGTNRVSNLGLACVKCNQAKGSMRIEDFLKDRPDLLASIKKQLRKPLKDASAVNAARNKLLKTLQDTSLPVLTGTGGLTKYNRSKFKVAKTHALDAACVGEIKGIANEYRPHIHIKSTGRGRYSRTILNKYGFPRVYLTRSKKCFGFQTGDIVSYKKPNTVIEIISRASVRSTGYFDILEPRFNKRISVLYKNCHIVQNADGYSYGVKEYDFLLRKDGGGYTLGFE